MKKAILLVFAMLLMAVNYSFGQAFTKAEKEVFYKDYMQELNAKKNWQTEEKEDCVYCFLQELNKMDRKVYDNMIDFEKRKMMEGIKSYCSIVAKNKSENEFKNLLEIQKRNNRISKTLDSISVLEKKANNRLDKEINRK